MDDEEDIDLQRQRLDDRAGETTDTIPGEPVRTPHDALTTPPDMKSSVSLETGERLPRQARLRRAVIAAGAVLIAVAVLAVTLPNTGATLRALLHIPTPVPTAPLAIGAGTFLMIDTVPWGTLLVDGREPHMVVPPPNSPGGPSGTPQFTLGRGRYAIEYRAAPFPTLRCTVSVPAAPTDTCPLVGNSVVSGNPGVPFAVARVLDLEARPERLSGAALASLEQAVVAALNASVPPETLAIGDHYRAADGTIHAASQPLVAALAATLNQDSSVLLPGDSGPCETLCRSFQSDFSVPNQGIWLIGAHVIVSWRITRPDGTVVVTDAPASPVAYDAHQMVLVGASWHGAWSATTAYGGGLGVCSIAAAVISEVIAAATQNAGLLNYQQYVESPPNGAADCLIVEVKVMPNGGGPVAGQQAWVLYRCGALVAVNAQAHALLPLLPLASAHEQAVAQTLLGPNGQG